MKSQTWQPTTNPGSVPEMRVLFVSSYPYSEEYTKPTQYMNTRCPAWCDRILMSHTAQTFIRKVSQDVLFPVSTKKQLFFL